MKLESQVVSLSLAQRLKELGVEFPDSHFVWQLGLGTPFLRCSVERGQSYTYVDAPTVAELGEMLPYFVVQESSSQNTFGQLQMWKDASGGFGVLYDGLSLTKEDGHEVFDKSEADARAKMLIYLLEQKLVTARDINERIEV
jgi:hypothetical protein